MKSLAFILFVMTVIGLFKPKFVLPFQKTKTRKRVLFSYGVAFVIVVIISGAQSNGDALSSNTNSVAKPAEESAKIIFNEIIKLEKEARLSSQFKFPVYGSELSVGGSFIITEETILMNKLNPDNPTEVIKDLQKLPSGTGLKILENLDRERAWRVKIVGSDEEGFILKSALDHQKVPESDEAQARQQEEFYRLKGQADSLVMKKFSLSRQQLDSVELAGIKQGWNY